MLVDQHAVEAVRVSRGDGLGVSMLREAGVPFVIVSKERNPVVGARAAKLEVDVLQGVDDKVCALTAWLDRRGLQARQVAYVGNDINDLPVMAAVGWPVSKLPISETPTVSPFHRVACAPWTTAQTPP